MMMSAIPDYYTGFTQAEVEAIFANQKAELKKTQQAYAEDGSSVNKRRLDEINLIIQGCQNALIKFDPTTYSRKRRRVIQTGVIGYLEK
jgi:hypothetical protein